MARRYHAPHYDLGFPLTPSQHAIPMASAPAWDSPCRRTPS